MTNLSILTRYTSQGASSRYRYFLYLSRLLKNDYNLEVDSFFDTSYLNRVYSSNRKNLFKNFFSYLKRLIVVINSSDDLIIEYELFPYMPYFFEKFLLRNKKYILNFDDNVWDNYENKIFLKNKYDSLVKNASGVIVANSFLMNKVNHKNIIKIPTVIDLDDYQENTISKNQKFSIVWIGTPVTYKYIKSFSNVFKELAKMIDYELLIIAKKSLESDAIDGVNMKFFDWSSSLEVKLLKESHLGIMPLQNDQFSQGKSAFKIIQYMAAGLPVIASNIGENNNVVSDGENGFLVANEDEWINKVSLLYSDEELRSKISNNALKESYEYSIQKYFDSFNDFVDKTFSERKDNLL